MEAECGGDSMENGHPVMSGFADISRDTFCRSTETEAGYKKIFTDTMQQRGLRLQQETLRNLKIQRERRERVEKEAPADVLAREWFSQDKASVGTRSYLLEQLMPSVVHGVESLLMEVEKKKVLEDDSVKFDPVNYLGEFLMRQNPEFFSGTEKSAYVRGLEQVVADLKNNVFDLEFNRLGQLKEELKFNQDNREQVESIQSQVMEKRKGALSLQFQEWTLDVSGRIPLALVQSALKSFFEDISQLALDKPVYSKEVETADTMEQKLNEEQFVEYVYPFISRLSTDLFQEFLHHMAQCADMFRETIRHDIWRQKFSDLFLACDSGKVGFLDRQRVLSLIEKFYDRISSKAETWHPRNPRQWPVIELGEMDPADFWAEFQEGDNQPEEKGENPTTTASTLASGSGEEGGKEEKSEDTEEGAAHREENTRDQQTEDSGSRVTHFIEGKPWSGDLLTSDLAIRYSSYGDRSEEEYRDAASKFTDLRTIISDINTRGPSRIPSAFNDSALNLPQFVQLMETFVGEEAPLAAVQELTSYIQKEYVETEEEKIALLAKVRQEALRARQKLVLQALFEKWDNDGSGFIELQEVEGVLAKYKEGMEAEVVTKGRESLSSSQSRHTSRKLSASEFMRYILGLVRQLPGPEEEVYENLVEFLTTSVERTQSEKLRGASRRKWLQHIQSVAETSGGRFEPVYKAVFQALYKDAEAHGNDKKISANIALLEQASVKDRWNEVLRYVACTSEDATYVLNKILTRDMKSVSFAAVDSGIPQHVPRVQYHGNVQFWNAERSEEERKGSLIVLPLMDKQQRVFGTLGIDTLRELRDRNIFLTHEISFYQGVTNAFSAAYHHVQRQRNIIQLVSSALAWIYSRAPNIRAINTYLMEPCVDKAQGYVFRNMMHTDNNTGVSEVYSSPATLRRRDNLFRDYLFKCADSSEVITTDAYGERHIAVPIRDPSGRALGVLDLNTGHCRNLPAHEYQDLQKMLQMLQGACYEILEEEPASDTPKRAVLESKQ
ncbi:EF-hand calcium-binding domain-containing protein 5 isoform X2 [Dendropsophus ebraccatus]|uniref:EF-hand calcium-binding domain-containing protein 5 isoform X2 n=1 Tax=Dendropsophus ebraccatus TaxID=150705 RepID=UPI003831E40A